MMERILKSPIYCRGSDSKDLTNKTGHIVAMGERINRQNFVDELCWGRSYWPIVGWSGEEQCKQFSLTEANHSQDSELPLIKRHWCWWSGWQSSTSETSSILPASGPAGHIAGQPHHFTQPWSIIFLWHTMPGPAPLAHVEDWEVLEGNSSIFFGVQRSPELGTS